MVRTVGKDDVNVFELEALKALFGALDNAYGD